MARAFIPHTAVEFATHIPLTEHGLNPGFYHHCIATSMINNALLVTESNVLSRALDGLSFCFPLEESR